MPSIKEFNIKIKSLKNTRKITKTMKMVSASKLRKAQQAQANAKLYAQNIKSLISRISASAESGLHSLLMKREKIKKVLILVVTSDKGLCGAFNNNANKQVLHWMREHKSEYEKIDLSFAGKRGFNFFRRLAPTKIHYEQVTASPSFTNAKRIGADLVQEYISQEYDEIYMTYNQFLSPISQKTCFEKLLPIDPMAILTEEPAKKADYIYEPEATDLLAFLIPNYLYFRIYFTLLENSAGEHAARVAAMDNATKNASELIDRYTLLRNRARQAGITTELTEIVAGAEAQK